MYLAWPWLAVGLLGAIVGSAELVSRYRDAPSGALRTRAAIFYIVLNTLASLGAYGLAKVFGWKFNPGDSSNALASETTLVLVCGIGAMALFRSSLFIRRIGDRDIGVGPSSFLQIFLTAADAEVDRNRGVFRSASVTRIMNGVDYAKASKALPVFCLGLLQNLPDDVQRDLRKAVELLNGEQMENDSKILLLGLALVNAVGVPVLEEAVKSLGARIRV